MRIKKPEASTIRALCAQCGKNPQKGTTKGKYQALCGPCDHRRFGTQPKKYTYKGAKKQACDKCGFVAEHPCQLDVDHIDGNHKNNEPSNWQTLCANCHRLKTFKQRFPDHQPFQYKLKTPS